MDICSYIATMRARLKPEPWPWCAQLCALLCTLLCALLGALLCTLLSITDDVRRRRRITSWSLSDNLADGWEHRRMCI